MESDPRLFLKCCGASSKELCSWPPCPANMDCYSSGELREFIAVDAWRVDDAVAIWTGPVSF